MHVQPSHGEACLSPRELISYLADELNPTEHDRVESHVAHCTQCEKRLEQLAGSDSSSDQASLLAAHESAPEPLVVDSILPNEGLIRHEADSSSKTITQILHAIDQGDQAASEELLPRVYQELRKLAADRLSRESAAESLQPTELVHEAYVRLVDGNAAQQWNGRGHFFGAAAEAMRRILIENARRKLSKKRGGALRRISLADIDLSSSDRHEELLAIHEALTKLEERWPDRARIVKLRYFAGLSVPEAAKAMGISPATGGRYWRFARAWLHAQLGGE